MSHSCDPNCVTALAAYKGELTVALHSKRKIRRGEEMTIDYNTLTDSIDEMRAAVCLCGSARCRGSFLSYTGAEPTSSVLHSQMGLPKRLAMLTSACATANGAATAAAAAVTQAEEQEMGSPTLGGTNAAAGVVRCERERMLLREYGFGPSVLGEGDEAASMGTNVSPAWLRTWVVSVLEFMARERKQLPAELMKLQNIVPPYNEVTAMGEATAVAEQRAQSLAIVMDVVKHVLRQQQATVTPAKGVQVPTAISATASTVSSVAAAAATPPPFRELLQQQVVDLLWLGKHSVCRTLIDCLKGERRLAGRRVAVAKKSVEKEARLAEIAAGKHAKALAKVAREMASASAVDGGGSVPLFGASAAAGAVTVVASTDLNGVAEAADGADAAAEVEKSKSAVYLQKHERLLEMLETTLAELEKVVEKYDLRANRLCQVKAAPAATAVDGTEGEAMDSIETAVVGSTADAATAVANREPMSIPEAQQALRELRVVMVRGGLVSAEPTTTSRHAAAADLLTLYANTTHYIDTVEYPRATSEAVELDHREVSVPAELEGMEILPDAGHLLGNGGGSTSMRGTTRPLAKKGKQRACDVAKVVHTDYKRYGACFVHRTLLRWSLSEHDESEAGGGGKEALAAAKAEEEAAAAMCQVCGRGDGEDSMLLCGDGAGHGCDKGYHIYCLQPALPALPSGDWYCDDCEGPGKKAKKRRVKDTKGAKGSKVKLEAGGEGATKLAIADDVGEGSTTAAARTEKLAFAPARAAAALQEAQAKLKEKATEEARKEEARDALEAVQRMLMGSALLPTIDSCYTRLPMLPVPPVSKSKSSTAASAKKAKAAAEEAAGGVEIAIKAANVPVTFDTAATKLVTEEEQAAVDRVAGFGWGFGYGKGGEARNRWLSYLEFGEFNKSAWPLSMAQHAFSPKEVTPVVAKVRAEAQAQGQGELAVMAAAAAASEREEAHVKAKSKQQTRVSDSSSCRSLPKRSMSDGAGEGTMMEDEIEAEEERLYEERRQSRGAVSLYSPCFGSPMVDEAMGMTGAVEQLLKEVPQNRASHDARLASIYSLLTHASLCQPAD
jgi:hypothetical protein